MTVIDPKIKLLKEIKIGRLLLDTIVLFSKTIHGTRHKYMNVY